jgi:hypothetical protein
MEIFNFKSSQSSMQNFANIANLLGAILFLVAALVPFIGSDPG